MPTADVAFVVVCGVGTLNSLFLAAYLFATGKGESRLNQLLAALILTFSFRVGKAVALLFARHLHPLFELLWVVALALTGVAALLYGRRLAARTPAGDRRQTIVVAGALIAGAGLVAVLPLGGLWRVMAAALTVYGAGLAGALCCAWGGRAATDPLTTRWQVSLLAFLCAIWTLHVSLVLARLAGPVAEDDFFKVEAVLFSLATYVLVYVELRYGVVGRLHQPSARVDPSDPMLLRLRRAVEEERLFLDPALSLPSLARSLRLSPQHVSRLINAGIGSSFNDYVNRLRVEEACRLLSAPGAGSRKTGSVADECGFRSSSVFYSAFRKFTGQTPAEYQKNALRS